MSLFFLFLQPEQQKAQHNILRRGLDGIFASGPLILAPGCTTFQTTMANHIGTASKTYMYHSCCRMGFDASFPEELHQAEDDPHRDEQQTRVQRV